MLNEHDLADYEQLPIQPLYNVRARSYVMVPDMDNAVIFMDHLDGMYSFCLNAANEVVHLAAWAEVIPLVKKSVDTE
jgi:hypothetical protein